MDRVHLVECPRDALQGWPHKVSTNDKLGYYKTLYQVGFDTLDMGSFVSPKAVPSMANTAKILRELEEGGVVPHSHTRTLVIVANERGAAQASEFGVINDLGFPLSLSESFQQRNTGGSIDEAYKRIDAIQNICEKSQKRLVVYLSMGFGNPYGDHWHPDMLLEFSQKLFSRYSTQVIALSDTVGTANEDIIKSSFEAVINELPRVEFGAHLHLNPLDGMGKIQAAIDGGCSRFDGAIRGIGGCPMAQDDLVGNAPTEKMIEMFSKQGLWSPKNTKAWSQAQSQATVIFESN
jgi:hydroxymethylglutaryl-CoA lyase